MYGAVLCPRTELTEIGEANIGVLFLTNEGYSTMCGHATLALGRLLVDYAGTKASGLGALHAVKRIRFDEENKEAHVHLHAPCGLVYITVPITRTADGGWSTDLAHPISYRSVPSYATGISVHLDIPTNLAPSQLAQIDTNNKEIVFDVSYGGAFYIIVSANTLGFSSIGAADYKALCEAAAKLKAAFNAPGAEKLRKKHLMHPDHRDLEFLYGVIVTEPEPEHQGGAENGLCFFADGQVDRSPTGSGVQARVALAYAKEERKLNESFVYHSPVSKSFDNEGSFMGEAIGTVEVGEGLGGVIVKVSGWAKYTGCASFVIEENDKIGSGFWFENLIKG